MRISVVLKRPFDATYFVRAAAFFLVANGAIAQDLAPQFQACGVLSTLETDAPPTCHGKLIGGASPDSLNCPANFKPVEDLEFDDSLHARWYDRFWSGKCVGFSFWHMCTEDPGGWNETVEKLTARVPEEDRPRARAELWAIGRMIGYEWAKRNDIRKISTGDLSAWWKDFEADPDPWNAMRTLCQEATGKLGLEGAVQ